MERGERVALFAAEAGVAAAQEYVRNNCSPTDGLNPLDGQLLPRDLPNNADDKPPLTDLDASYSVTFHVDGACNGILDATSKIACVAVRSQGQGPGGATALIRVRLSRKCESGGSTSKHYADTNTGDVVAADIDQNAPEQKGVPDAGL